MLRAAVIKCSDRLLLRPASRHPQAQTKISVIRRFFSALRQQQLGRGARLRHFDIRARFGVVQPVQASILGSELDRHNVGLQMFQPIE